MHSITFSPTVPNYNNAIQASIYTNYIVCEGARSGVRDPIALLNQCGIVVISGSATLIENPVNYFQLKVTTNLHITIPTGFCEIIFKDRHNTYTRSFYGDTLGPEIELPAATYGFDEVNFLGDPTYLYRQNNLPYFYRINKSDTRTSTLYGQLDEVGHSKKDTIGGRIDTPQEGCYQYSMPNFGIDNKDLFSVGYEKTVIGTNPFTYSGRVFNADSNLPNTKPANQGCYQEGVPEIICWQGKIVGDGRCDTFSYTGNKITVIGRRVSDSSITQRIEYPITDPNRQKIVRYRRSGELDSLTFPRRYLKIRGDKCQVTFNTRPKLKVNLLGEEVDGTAAITLTMQTHSSMTVQEGRQENGTGSGRSPTSDFSSLFESVVVRPTGYDNSRTYTLPAKTADGAQTDNLFVTIGRCSDNKTKYTTTYKLAVKCKIDRLKGENISLPPTAGSISGTQEPHINTIYHIDESTVITNPPTGSVSVPKSASYGIPLLFSIQLQHANDTSTGIIPSQRINIFQPGQEYTLTNETTSTTSHPTVQNGQTTTGVDKWRVINYYIGGGHSTDYDMYGRMGYNASSTLYAAELCYYDSGGVSDYLNTYLNVIGSNYIQYTDTSIYTVVVMGHKDGGLNP